MEQTQEGSSNLFLAGRCGFALAAIIGVVFTPPLALAAQFPVSDDPSAAGPREDASSNGGNALRGLARELVGPGLPEAAPAPSRTRPNGGRQSREGFFRDEDGGQVAKRAPFHTPPSSTRKFSPNVPVHSPAPVGRSQAGRGGDAGGMICVTAFIIVIVFAVVVAVNATQRQRTTEAYSLLAQHNQGTCTAGGWSSRPVVRFRRADCQVTVDVYSTGGQHQVYYTQVHFYGRQPAVRCEVYPEGAWSRIGKLVGMEDIQIGSPDFDDRYIIKGDGPTALRSLLTPAVQMQIERLRRFLDNDNIYVSLNQRELLVKKLSFIREYSVLLEFTQLAIDLYDQVVLPLDDEIKFVEKTEPPELSEAICQICGEPITSQEVFCRRCKTPHHLDCWQYYGACSTYGCRETRCLQRKPKRRAKSPRPA
jgi:hypothetical protein